jgi:L-lactate dehydrogenase complex protein LldG
VTGEDSARDVVLGRIRAALGPDRSAHPGRVPRDYDVHGPHPAGAPELLDLLVDRLLDYRALVRRCGPDDVAATVATALAERGARRIVVPADLDPTLLAALDDVDVLRDAPAEPVPVPVLDVLDGVVSGCAVAIAGTGTLALDSTAGCGRRVITLVPDFQLVVVQARQVVGGVPEALARLSPDGPVTLISGPSATSDIEFDRVEGVHGPRTLEVVLVG